MSEFPPDWTRTTFGNVLKQRKEAGFTNEELLAVTSSLGIVRRDTLERRDTSNEDKSKYLLVEEGDIAYNTMRMWQGVSGVSRFRGIVSPAYTICTPTEEIDKDFAGYLLRDPEIISIFRQRSQGLVSDTWNLKYESFAQIPCTIPPLPEQKKIAEILSGIDRLICTENDCLSALNRLLQSHLSSSRFSEGEPIAISDACLLVADCMHKTPMFEETGYPIVRTPNVRDGNLIFEGMKFISESSYQEWVRKDKPEPGDILFTREAPLGEACIVPNGLPLCIGQRMMLLRADKRILSPEFLLFRLRSLVAQQKLQLMSGGSTVGHANVKDIRSLEIEVPSHAEQSVAIKIYQSISSSISTHSAMREKLLNLKSAISNDLLSGRKRVSV